MNHHQNNYCVILAGGKGRRLWPCSREEEPKQFIDFFGMGRTQLQQTYDRFAKILPKENIYVSTNQEYEHFVKEQLPDLPKENIFNEPVHRNTAPSVAWACYRISHVNPDANLIVSPSDQAVNNEKAFFENIDQGFEFVAHNEGILTMGVKPTRPEPGYGYIQLGDETEIKDLFHVKSFTEKPEREFARMFMESGEFYWNTGIILCNVRYMIGCLQRILPVVMRQIDVEDMHLSYEEENEFVQANFRSYPNISIDYGILEKSDQVFVMRGDFGWADLGTWHSTYEALSRSNDDNVVIDSDVMIEDSRNNIIKLPKGRLGVISGLDGFIVAEKDNVLFICKKGDSSALVRKYLNEVQMKKGEDYI